MLTTNSADSRGTSLLRRFLRDERGLETVEYAIMAGLIVSGLVAIVASIGAWVKQRFANLLAELEG